MSLTSTQLTLFDTLFTSINPAQLGQKHLLENQRIYRICIKKFLNYCKKYFGALLLLGFVFTKHGTKLCLKDIHIKGHFLDVLFDRRFAFGERV